MTDQLLETFWDKVEVQINGCWMWKGALNNDGYPIFRDGKLVLAHRFAYQVNNGNIPHGLTVDHLCRNRDCVNPEHMEIVTQRENVLRGTNTAAMNAKKTHCPKGHPYTGNNLIVRNNNNRVCRACHNQRSRENKYGR